MNPVERLSSRRRGCAFCHGPWILLLGLGSCSLQDFDRLNRGSLGAGGDAAHGGVGGTETGSTTGVIGGRHSSDDAAAGQAGTAVWGSAGSRVDGYSGNAGSSLGGVDGADAGQPGVGGNLAGGSGGTSGTSACAAGAAGCPNPTCGPEFIDCNHDMATDGCETFIHGLATCGTSCTNLVACQSNQVCNAGACGAPQGLVKLSVPLTESGQGQRYGYKFPTGTDLSKATIVFRMYAPGALGGSLNIYPTDVDRLYGAGVNQTFVSAASGWVDVRIPLGDARGTGVYDPGNLYQLTLEIQADGAGPWANPTDIYVDGLWSTNGIVRESFENSIGPMVASTLLLVEGSVLSWVDTL